MRNPRLFCLLCLAVCGVILLAAPRPVLGQVADSAPAPSEIIPQQEIPGDTLVLLIAAIFLGLIVFGGVLWRSGIFHK